MLVLQGLLLNVDAALEAPVMVHFTVLHVEQVAPRVLSIRGFVLRSELREFGVSDHKDPKNGLGPQSINLLEVSFRFERPE